MEFMKKLEIFKKLKETPSGIDAKSCTILDIFKNSEIFLLSLILFNLLTKVIS